MKEQWYCIDLAALFDSKNKYDDNYVDCEFGSIDREPSNISVGDYYYDFGTTGMPRLCCDGEQCKLIKVEDNVLTFLSDGNSYEDTPEVYYFKLTEEEAKIAGVIL